MVRVKKIKEEEDEEDEEEEEKKKSIGFRFELAVVIGNFPITIILSHCYVTFISCMAICGSLMISNSLFVLFSIYFFPPVN